MFFHPTSPLSSTLLAPVRDWSIQGGNSQVFVVRPEAWMKRIIRLVAKGGFVFYVVWNVTWISKGRVPPSIMRALLGIPCPTTGATRSFLALCRGEYLQSFFLNPMMIVYVLLFVYSLAVLLRQAIHRQPLVLNSICAWAWGSSLILGWIAKFAMGREYW